MVLINFKNYPQSTLDNAEKLLNDLSKVRVPSDINLAFSLSPLDLGLARTFGQLSLFSQHADENDPGASTGKITIEGLMNLGIMGSLLNHSENRIGEKKIAETVMKAKRLDFDIVLCVEDADEAKKYASLEPRYIAYEPPELIGGNVSVSTSKPEIITEVVTLCDSHDVPVLVGAGVKNRGDLVKSLELGAKGVLIASGIVKSADPKGSLTSLISS